MLFKHFTPILRCASSFFAQLRENYEKEFSIRALWMRRCWATEILIHRTNGLNPFLSPHSHQNTIHIFCVLYSNCVHRAQCCLPFSLGQCRPKHFRRFNYAKEAKSKIPIRWFRRQSDGNSKVKSNMEKICMIVVEVDGFLGMALRKKKKQRGGMEGSTK